MKTHALPHPSIGLLLVVFLCIIGSGCAGTKNTGDGDATHGASVNKIFGPISEIGVPYDIRYPRGDGTSNLQQDGPAEWFGLYAHVPEIIAQPYPDGTIDIAWIDDTVAGNEQIFITQIAKVGLEYESRWHLEVPTLNQLVGFTRDEENNFYVMTAIREDLGQEQGLVGAHRDGILELTRINRDSTLAYKTQMRTDIIDSGNLPIYSPMTWGTGRIVYGAGRIAATFSANTSEYDSNAGARHQGQRYIIADSGNGEVLEVLEAFGHSFDQWLGYDGSHFIGMGMGDAWQRGMNISKLGLSDEAHQIAFGLKGGNVNVYSRLGDVQFGNNGYVALFATENTPSTVPWPNFVAGSRNLALIHIVQNFDQLQHEGRSFDPEKYDVRIVDTHLHNTAAENFEVIVEPYGPYTAYNKGVVWLTDYDDIDDAHADRPKMVKINGDRFMVLWEKWTQTEYIETFAMIVDEYGHILSPAASLGNSARLHRGDDAFALGDKAAWVVGEADVPRLVLYTVDENLSLEVLEIL